MTILIIRANHANEFELQNYRGIEDLKVITSQHPLTDISLTSTKLWSPTDLPNFPYRRQILNRLIGGEQWLVELESLIKAGDIVHTAETYTPYTHQAVELRKRGLISKLVCTCWETIAHNNEKFRRLGKWKTEAYHYVDIFHTPTQRAKQALVKEGIDPGKVVVIPYGVDLGRFHPVTHKLGRRLQILTVARLEPEKGMSDLEAVAHTLPQYDFHIVGKGSYRPRGSNIRVTSVPYTQIHHAYQAADLFFLPSVTTPSWEEQYGMALVEAMSCGLPIVSTHSGAIPEVVGDAALLVPEKNVDKMVKTIASFAANPDLRTRLSSASLKRAQKYYDATKQAEKLSQLYS